MDLDEGLVLPVRVADYGIGNKLLSYTAFSRDQDACPGRSYLLDGLYELLDLGTLADDLGITVLPAQVLQFCPQLAVLLRHVLTGQRPLDQDRQMVQIHGLGQEVHGTVLHGRNGILYGSVTGEHYYGDGGISGVDLLQKLATAHVRHPEVRDHHVHRFGIDDVPGGLAVLCLQSGVTVHLKGGNKTFADVFLVIDYKYGSLHD